MNQELLRKIAASSQLPTLPMIAIKTLELTQKENVNISEIASLLVNDPALASKILRTVNSPFYGLPKQVSTISHALVILGLQAVKTLALGFSLVNNLNAGGQCEQTGAFDYMDFWKRSIYSAVAARQIAKQLSLVQQEEAFLSGLLANVGVLVMHRVLGQEFDTLITQAAGDPEKLYELCRKALDLDPPDVAGVLTEKWQLPPVLARPIALHHTREHQEGQLDTLIDVVGAGVIIAQIFVAADSAQAITRARQELAARFNFAPPEIEKILDEIGRSTRDAAKLFELHIGPARSYQQILDEAREALENLTLKSQKQVQNIQKEFENLQVKATTDVLTGLANRSHFDQFFEEQFQRAIKQLRPLALIFIDIDNFKKVNDTCGHEAGDTVLRHIAKVLRASVRPIDLAARFGGEEFAVVLTEVDTAAAASRAEAIRKAIAAQTIRLESEVIQVTVSLGVAGTDRTRIFTHAAQLLKSSDQATYAAKAAGRNAVRVFRPKAAIGAVSSSKIAPT